MAELSRGELLAWVNDLTNLNLPKVESMGTGAAHCLIIHSIFGDVPTHKINFKTVHEYEYVHNFKVLQEAFTRHRIDRVQTTKRKRQSILLINLFLFFRLFLWIN